MAKTMVPNEGLLKALIPACDVESQLIQPFIPIP